MIDCFIDEMAGQVVTGEQAEMHCEKRGGGNITPPSCILMVDVELASN